MVLANARELLAEVERRFPDYVNRRSYEDASRAADFIRENRSSWASQHGTPIDYADRYTEAYLGDYGITTQLVQNIIGLIWMRIEPE